MTNPESTEGPDQLLERIGAATDHAGAKGAPARGPASSPDYRSLLQTKLFERLPERVLELFAARTIVLGVVDDEQPNTRVERAENGGYAIVFNSGLSAFLYRISRALATSPELSGFGSSDHSTSESDRIIGEVLWWFRESGKAFGPGYDLSAPRLAFASRLATEAEVFFVCHEVGHALLGLAGKATGGQGEEAAADEIGALLALGGTGEAHQELSPTQLAYAGVEFSIQAFRALAKTGARFPSTHGHADTRLENLQRIGIWFADGESEWRSLSAIASHVESILGVALGRIVAQAKLGVCGSDGARLAVAEFDRLLTLRSGHFVPDYYSFLNEATDLLNRGHAPAIISRIGEIAESFGEYLNPPPRTGASEAALVVFHQYKLLYRLSEEAPEPAKSAIRRALGWVAAPRPTSS